LVAVTPRLWLGVLLVLALSWLSREARQAALDYVGLQVALALACGEGAVLLRKTRAGLARGTGVIVLLLVCLAIGTVWLYLDRSPREPFSWPDAIGGTLTFLVVPGIAAVLYGNRQLGAGWTFIQVTTLALVAAPVSATVSFMLAVAITGE